MRQRAVTPNTARTGRSFPQRGGELAAGKYCLAADVKLTEDLLVSGEVTLCLNGYILTGTGTGPVIMVESGADFTLCDCREGAADVANEINGVTYNSGAITGGSAEQGGGAYVNGGSFAVSGGAIAGNTAFSGGGVCMWGGTFTMEGGTVSGNEATHGGGVCIREDSAFILEGGTIVDNAAISGGGIYRQRQRLPYEGRHGYRK